MLKKNVASQKVAVLAWDVTDDEPKTGDAANITAQISKDGGACAATNDVNPTELDATDAKGVYLFDLTQAETNADLIVISAVSSTANIKLDPIFLYPHVDVPATYGEVSDVAASTTIFDTDLSEATNDHYNNMFVCFLSGVLAGQSRKISDYDGTGKTITVATAFTDTPGNGDEFVILGRSE